MVLFGLVHDILETSGLFDNGIQLTPYLMFLFIFVQANILARRSSMAFVQVEELSARLNFVNQNLEKMVAERTHRIEKQNSELEKQSRKIDKQNRELQKTVDSRNLVLTVIGHDLRGPIGNISEMIDLLLSADIDGETQQQILSAIRQSATSSFTLLENLMYWGRAQSGKISYNPDLYSVREIAGEALNLLESAAREKNITLENFIPPDQMAWCDFSHVNLIIRNLVNNSIKFTDNGGHIIVSSRVRNNPQNKQKYLEVLVRDDGIGIPPEKLEMIFSSDKVETTWGTNNEKGSGIGLPLVKEFVNINKGQIYARSKVGEFTTFFFTLPMKQ
jgi:signal transduction histidine kinase